MPTKRSTLARVLHDRVAADGSRRYLRLAVAAWLLGACCCNVPAASNARFAVDKWTTEDGLPQSVVLAIIQTQDGYLWLGTPKGLTRFDGVHFEKFDESNTPGLSSGRILKLFEDSQTNLWVGTENAGVVLVSKDGRVTSPDIGRGSSLSAVCEDAAGAVWFYTIGGQLARWRNERVEGWSLEAGVPLRFGGLAIEDSGLLLVGMEGSLSAFNPRQAQAGHELARTNEGRVGKLDYLLPSKHGGYWRLADGFIQRWRGGRLEGEPWKYPWAEHQLIPTACEDLEGNLVVGTYGEGVYWFDAKGGFTRLSGGKELSHNSILSLAVDREGCLWVGTNGGGLNRVKRQVFDVLESSQGLTVQSVCEDEHGGLWIGYNGEEIQYWSSNTVQRFAIRAFQGELAVRSVFVAQDQKVWAGTFGRGLLQLQDGRFQAVPFTGIPDPLLAQVSAVYQDRNGMIWAGTQDGLVRWAAWDNPNWRVFTNLAGASASAVLAVVDDTAGNFWVGTDGGGLLRLRLSGLTSFTRTNGFPSDHVASLCIDAEKVLWAGTSRGLARFDGAKWTTFTKQEGLADNSIGYLLADGKGYLWLGSSAGLMRVQRRALKDFADGLTNIIPVRVYGKEDGLPTGECTDGSQPAACRARDGKLWFPTTKGLAFVNPALLHPNTNPPPVVIEAVRVDGQLQNSSTLRAPLPQSVTVPADREGLDIAYTSLNLASPDKGHFRYRLSPHETAWIERPWNVRTVHYSKLPHRDYQFQVQACNEDGVWSEHPGALAIKVLPPFWHTWWFITLTSAGLLGMIVGSVHYVSTQRLQRQVAALRQKEALEKERARIARDIHDQVGANLTQLSLLGELVESDKDHPKEVEEHARHIEQTALETTRALDEIVWTVNPSNDTLDGLINYVCKYAQDYLSLAGLRYRLEVPPQLPNISITPELRHNVFLAAKEAVNNVVKHSQAKAVWLRLRLELGRFTLEIEDNGRGLSPDAANKGRNGLRNMRKRLEDVGGEFSIAPGAEGGTRVSLTAPLGRVTGEGS
jgi:ligand-binding sensor domain-containing protein/signal transduction histidine kinase